MLAELLINLIVLFIVGMGCLIIGALQLNNLPMAEPPGFKKRIWTYLSSNSAETRRNHTFPELELPCPRMAPGILFARIEHTLDLLDWQIVDSEPQDYRLRAVAKTPLLEVEDDIDIILLPENGYTELHIRSSSRVGRCDLGANTRHILNLLEMLARQV